MSGLVSRTSHPTGTAWALPTILWDQIPIHMRHLPFIAWECCLGTIHGPMRRCGYRGDDTDMIVCLKNTNLTVLVIVCLALVCSSVGCKSESMMGLNFQHELAQSVRPGMSRTRAEAQLHRLMVRYSFVSREEI